MTIHQAKYEMVGRGQKVTHPLLPKGEYLFFADGAIVDKNGKYSEDSFKALEEKRYCATGWSIYKEKDFPGDGKYFHAAPPNALVDPLSALLDAFLHNLTTVAKELSEMPDEHLAFLESLKEKGPTPEQLARFGRAVLIDTGKLLRGQSITENEEE